MKLHKTLPRVISAVIFLVAGQAAQAQTPGKPVSDEASYLVWVIFAGVALIILATGFMNSKRSHLN